MIGVKERKAILAARKAARGSESRRAASVLAAPATISSAAEEPAVSKAVLDVPGPVYAPTKDAFNKGSK